MNWYRVSTARLKSEDGLWAITREIVFGDKLYFLWHADAIVGEALDYQALMEQADGIHVRV